MRRALTQPAVPTGAPLADGGTHVGDTALQQVELVVRTIAQAAVDNEKYFGDLDAVVGDGDFGYSLARGFEKVLEGWDDIDRTDVGAFLKKIGMIITSRIGGTSGPIWGTAFMKAGIFYADRITTVSPGYALEIQGTELGCGLDGLLRERSALLSGILNGVDASVWNPADDTAIARRYSAEKMTGKVACKTALQRDCGLAVQNDAPLFTVVSRLTAQKGLHLVAEALPAIVERGGQLVVLGTGDADLEAAFARAAQARPRQVALRQGYDEALSHRIFAASDVTLVPSRFEPCGLTQLYALKYGSLPLVHRTGGLADTVVDCTLEDMADERATGFVFDRFDAAELTRALRRVFALWARPRDWRTVRRRAMDQRFGWDTAAASYLALYRGLVSA